MKDYLSQSVQREFTCRDVAERISEYLDNHPTLLTKINVALHLASCAHCCTYLKQILLVRDAVAFLPTSYPSTINRLHLQQHFARCQSSRAVMSKPIRGIRATC
jgi:predicted anti-sigma-YlaC factor YlaD